MNCLRKKDDSLNIEEKQNLLNLFKKYFYSHFMLFHVLRDCKSCNEMLRLSIESHFLETESHNLVAG